jgi:tRNA A-37 threonylcarbamoyl transferase component Bud32
MPARLMAEKQHQRVKELFQRARYLDHADCEEYLRQTCAGDETLRRDVESLLAHHKDQTLMMPPSEATPAEKPRLSYFRRAAAHMPSATSRFSAMRKASGRMKGRLSLGVLLLLLLIAFDVWTYERVHTSLDELLADQLQTVLDADVMALRQWLAAVETDAQMWAKDPTVRTAIVALARLGDESGGSVEALKSSSDQATLFSTLAEAVRDTASVHSLMGDEQPGHEAGPLLTHRRFDGFGVVSAGGRLVAGYSPFDESDKNLGEMMSDFGESVLTRVLSGETVALPPFEQGAMVRGLAPDVTTPTMLVATPVLDDGRQVVALLAFLIEPSEEYEAILEAGRIGETGETYAFDANGVMLSESAFVDQLKELGLLKSEETSAVLQVQLRDPGVDLTQGGASPLAIKDRPRTHMAAAAIDEKRSGFDVSGYRDCRGVEVAGAWTWLSDYGFGVATEIDKAEGYAAMSALVTSLRVLFWGVIALVIGLIVFAAKNLSLQADVDLARQYGDYRIERVLGEGGVGTVFLANHKMFARPAAIKVLRKDRITPESEQRFQQEVQVTSQLTNPHTVQIYDFGKTTSGEFYYAMEYLPGLTLYQLVEKYRGQDQRRVVHIIRQICESLAEAHDLDIIHRDIKPMNILLCERGGLHDVVKVLDFGLVKDLDAPKDMQVTHVEEVTGSPLYMAPERFDSPMDVDARADIWAVGCVAYYLLAAREPFCGKSLMEIWSKVATEEPPPLRISMPTEVDPELEALVRRCLAKNREDRPQSVHEILSTLAALDLRPWSSADARRWWEDREGELPHPAKIIRQSTTL